VGRSMGHMQDLYEVNLRMGEAINEIDRLIDELKNPSIHAE